MLRLEQKGANNIQILKIVVTSILASAIVNFCFKRAKDNRKIDVLTVQVEQQYKIITTSKEMTETQASLIKNYEEIKRSQDYTIADLRDIVNNQHRIISEQAKALDERDKRIAELGGSRVS